MAQSNNPLTQLINTLKIFPGVGPKTAQRMAFYLLEENRKGAQELVHAIDHALNHLHHCTCCNTFCEGDICELCADEHRDRTRIMIVQMPTDITSMENAACHDGLYFVLMGEINPSHNKDLQHINISKLIHRLQTEPVEEIIIATNFTMEGDATAYVLHELLKHCPCKITRLAKGMPLGSELEYIDAGTLAQAVYERKQLK